MLDALFIDAAAVIPESTWNTALTVIGSIAVAVVTGAFLVATRRRGISESEKNEQSKPVVPATPLSKFSGTQNEFMELVIRDNAELRSRVDSVERAQQAEAARHADFRRAVRRYLTRLASDWPGPDAMPWPDEADITILEDTLPRFRPRPRSGI